MLDLDELEKELKNYTKDAEQLESIKKDQQEIINRYVRIIRKMAEFIIEHNKLKRKYLSFYEHASHVTVHDFYFITQYYRKAVSCIKYQGKTIYDTYWEPEIAIDKLDSYPAFIKALQYECTLIHNSLNASIIKEQAKLEQLKDLSYLMELD